MPDLIGHHGADGASREETTRRPRHPGSKAREGFGKLIDELANTMKYYRHPGVHRISGVRVGSWLAVLDISIPDWHAF
jgi:hypothetical protein